MLLLGFFFACQTPQKKDKTDKRAYTLIDSTEHFRIEKKDYYYRLSIQNPFAGSDAKEQYIFYPEDSTKPSESDIQHFIQTPVKNLVATSTTHLGFMKALGKSDAIRGAKNMRYVYDADFLAKLKSGKIVDLGEADFNREKLIELNAHAVLAYAIDGVGFKTVEDLRQLNQKAVMIAEFMESNPIDKAKWLQVIALFFEERDLQRATDSIQAMEKRYNKLIALANTAEEKPDVMIGLPWKGTWYVAGGESFQAKLIADAQANYLWKDRKQKASLPLDIEYVFEHALNADYWINPGPAESLSDILERDHRFDVFEAYKNKKVYNQNKRFSKAGGNDYWESAVVKPDVVLADLIAIFHPQLLPDHKLYYYQKLD